MDYPLVLVTRLDELVLHLHDSGVIENASIYAAVRAIRQEFIDSKLWTNLQTREQFEAACFHMCAAAGYNASQKPKSKCIELAQLRLAELRATLNTLYL